MCVAKKFYAKKIFNDTNDYEFEYLVIVFSFIKWPTTQYFWHFY